MATESNKTPNLGSLEKILDYKRYAFMNEIAAVVFTTRIAFVLKIYLYEKKVLKAIENNTMKKIRSTTLLVTNIVYRDSYWLSR